MLVEGADGVKRSKGLKLLLSSLISFHLFFKQHMLVHYVFTVS